MEDIRQLLIEQAKEFGIKIKAHEAEKFQRYMELLLEWNEKINLTAITEPKEIVLKHFIDSLTLLAAVSIKPQAKVVDVGTGAGFPGIPLKILRPDIELTLLDSLNKRLLFLKEVCSELGISGEFVHKRAEEAGLQKNMREKYDIAIARAVAPLSVLAEYCVPLIKMKGLFIAMKGPGIKEEMKSGENALELLGANEGKVHTLQLGEAGERNLLVVQKINFTPRGYPRHGGTIAKHPL